MEDTGGWLGVDREGRATQLNRTFGAGQDSRGTHPAQEEGQADGSKGLLQQGRREGDYYSKVSTSMIGREGSSEVAGAAARGRQGGTREEWEIQQARHPDFGRGLSRDNHE